MSQKGWRRPLRWLTEGQAAGGCGSLQTQAIKRGILCRGLDHDEKKILKVCLLLLSPCASYYKKKSVIKCPLKKFFV